MKFLNRKLLYMGLAAFMTFIASCGGGGGGGGSTGAVGLPDNLDPTPEATGKGTVTILATDAETDQFREINLTITRAELLADDSSELLFEGEKTFNLLALASVTEVFSVAEVAAGSYDKIRLTLAGIELVFFDEREPVYPDLPGNGKLDINPKGLFYVDSDNPLTIQLDFDAEKSIHIVGTGNGGFNFRPVVLTKEVETEFDTKLIRQMGVVRELNRERGTFDLCLIEDEEAEEDDCVQVAVASGATAIFGESGNAIDINNVSEGDIATVVGRIYSDSDLEVAATGGGMALKRLSSGNVAALEDEPLCEEVEGDLFCGDMVCEEVEGQLICEEELVCDDIEGELVCEEIGEEEAPLCEEIEGQLICEDMVCEPFEGELLCDGNLFCNDIEGEFVCEEIDVEEPLCEEVEGDLICNDMECEEEDGMLFCEDDLVCDDIDGELVCEEYEDDENDECFEFEGHLICDDDCEQEDGLLFCDDDEVCEDVEGELVCGEFDDEEEECFEQDGNVICDDDCENVEGELLCEDEDEPDNDDCKEVEGELVCDDEEEEDDCREIDGELFCDDDEQEEDCREIEGELVCGDEEEPQDDEGDERPSIVVVADIIWLGDDFSRSENIACSSVDVSDALGTFFLNAELDGGEEVLCDSASSRNTVLLPGARVYDFDGNRLSPEAIETGAFNLVDGFVADNVLNAVLVIMEPVVEDDRRAQLSGSIGVLETEGLTLVTNAGDRCVVFDDSETDVFLTGLDESGNAVFSEGSVADLAEGQRADAFGEENDEGCLEAETLIVDGL